MSKPKLIVNKIRCKKCLTILHSKHVHMFVECPCGVFNDGGNSYQRRGWPGGKYEDWVEELSEYKDAE